MAYLLPSRTACLLVPLNLRNVPFHVVVVLANLCGIGAFVGAVLISSCDSAIPKEKGNSTDTNTAALVNDRR
jgi:amino acid permease